MQLFVVILAQASFYALLATGYVLIYRGTRIFNLAHGDLMVLGGYLYLSMLWVTEGQWTVSLLAAVVGAAGIGMIIYVVVMRPLAGYPPVVGVLATIALAIVARAAVTLIWSARSRHPGQLVPEARRVIRLPGDVATLTIDATMVVGTIVVLAALALLLTRTTTGVRLRATAERSLLAAQRGVNIHVMHAAVWGLAVGIATIAGAYYATKIRLGPDIWPVGLAGFAPALIGGMDSLKGVIPGALVVAFAEVMASRYLSPQLTLAMPFLLLLVVLWVRPWGLFGTHEELERV